MSQQTPPEPARRPKVDPTKTDRRGIVGKLRTVKARALSDTFGTPGRRHPEDREDHGMGEG